MGSICAISVIDNNDWLLQICTSKNIRFMKAMMRFITAGFVLSLFIMVSCSRSKGNDSMIKDLPNSIILEWNEIAFKAFDGPVYQHSLMASRINAMTHIAMHDALNAIYPIYKTYVFGEIDADADPIAAAASAAHTVLVNEIPAKKNFLDSALSKTLATVAEGNAKAKGIALGQQAAMAIINLRRDDGSGGEVMAQVPPSNTPGVYTAVPPFNILFAPQWEHVKLFSLQRKDQFRVAPHPSVNSTTYAIDLNEVKETGKINSASRTGDQTTYAKFWYEFSEAGWNRVARTAAAGRKLNLYETARLFALVDMAMADAYTAGWDSKFHYNFWRPYTAIRSAANDGNDATSPDANWEPSEPTPPVQDYPSTHSALGNAGATVLARLLGDNTPFTMTSFTAVPAGSTRSFNSFSQAANENADSRVRAGIHFRFSCVAGQELGTKIGNWTVDNYLAPVK
jgi:hypothetical protein